MQTRVREKLDCALGNTLWITTFAASQPIVDSVIGSDNTPIIFKIYRKDERVSRRFCFKEMWMTTRECKAVKDAHPTRLNRCGGELMR